MKLKHLRVERFRGIAELDWPLEGHAICLVGRGDSTKSTILDAVEFVLSARWNLAFTDCDFYNGNCDQPIVITATVGELPEELLTEDKFGLYQRGWDSEKGLIDEPDDGHEVVLTLKLFVDDSLEPQWTVVTDRHPDGKKISNKDRERIGATRLGSNVDRDLSWGRGSALSRLTADFEDLGKAIAEAHRCAHQTFSNACTPTLDKAARDAQTAAAELGVYVRSGSEFRPGLDTKVISPGIGAICLHEGEIPLRSSGLGSRRLAALALQRSGIPHGAIVLIDEVEHGLEPHRIRNLLRLLQTRPGLDNHAVNDHDELLGQVIMVTHSPVVVRELRAQQICVVHKRAERTEVLRAESELQPLLRSCPAAFLSKKIVMCEGKTEVGLLRSLEEFWAARHGGLPPAYHGVEFVEGGGRNHGPKRALQLSGLTYDVTYFGDSDEKIDPDETELTAANVKVLLWDGDVSVEERICLDLPWENLQEVLDLAIQIQEENTENAEQSILHRVATQLGHDPNTLSRDVATWLNMGLDDNAIRKAMGTSAKEKTKKKNGSGWFKQIESGEALGRIVAAALPRILDSDLAKKLGDLEDWMYAE